MKRALVIFSGLCLLGTPAAASTEISVDDLAPFDRSELEAALHLRQGADAGGDVRVARQGDGTLVVSVGDRAQVVELTDEDGASAARVVALVIVSLRVDDGAAGTARHVDDETPPMPAPPAPPTPQPWSYRVSLTFDREDNGYEIPKIHAGGGYALSAHARVVASAGLGHYENYLSTSSILVPLRVGLEGRAGAAGVEVGAQRTLYRESSCGGGEWGASQAVHGVGRVFLPPVGSRELSAEIGGYYVLDTSPTSCNSASNYTAYGGWVGVGVEWQ